MKKLISAAIAATAMTVGAGSAQAAFLDAPLPTNTYITVGNLDWAWISPCAPVAGSCDSSYGSYFNFQGTQGWRLPTAQEMATRPQASQFMFAGGNVPAGSTDPISGARFDGANGSSAGACATPYFSSVYRHCDYSDGVGGNIYPAGGGSFDTWAVRSVAAGVPEPATWAMMMLGFGAMGFAMRRRNVRSTTVAYA